MEEELATAGTQAVQSNVKKEGGSRVRAKLVHTTRPERESSGATNSSIGMEHSSTHTVEEADEGHTLETGSSVSSGGSVPTLVSQVRSNASSTSTHQGLTLGNTWEFCEEVSVNL